MSAGIRCLGSVSETEPRGRICRYSPPDTFSVRRFSSTVFRPFRFPREARLPIVFGLGFRVASTRFRGFLSEESIPLPEVKIRRVSSNAFQRSLSRRSRFSFLDSEFIENPLASTAFANRTALSSPSPPRDFEVSMLPPASFGAISPYGDGLRFSRLRSVP